MTPDQIRADLELAAKSLEFAHKLLNGTESRQDVIDALKELQTELPLARDWVRSDTCTALVAKMRDLEQRRILLDFLARFLSRQAGNDETEALRSLVGDAQLVIQGTYA